MKLKYHPLFLSAFLSLCLTLISLAVDAFHPEGLAEFKWGASLEETRKAMQARPEVTLSSETPNTLEYAGGTVANEPVQSWKFTFTDGKLDDIVVFLTPSNLEQAYSSLRKAINEKYRKPGQEQKGGGIHRATYWHYFMANHEWFVSCNINTDGIRLHYQDKPPRGASPADKKDL